jgi:hypothetical protein
MASCTQRDFRDLTTRVVALALVVRTCTHACARADPSAGGHADLSQPHGALVAAVHACRSGHAVHALVASVKKMGASTGDRDLTRTGEYDTALRLRIGVLTQQRIACPVLPGSARSPQEASTPSVKVLPALRLDGPAGDETHMVTPEKERVQRATDSPWSEVRPRDRSGHGGGGLCISLLAGAWGESCESSELTLALHTVLSHSKAASGAQLPTLAAYLTELSSQRA